ncbi:MAG: hypothetical protein CMK06_02215 [Ponticaulis sp.]|nr:hypothetical protein [Ponticaulis sp.]
MKIERVELPEQHYLYVDREVDFTNPAAIGEAMGSAFGEVFGFIGAQELTPLSMPMALYLEMPEDGKMRFRGGVFVSAEDASKAHGSVSADHIPAGPTFKALHVGPYSSLNETHKALWDHMATQGISGAMPVWEIYVDDPTAVPENECRTEICRLARQT